MASFTETATLLVKDQSSSKIKKINAELRELAQTAKALRSTTLNIGVNATAVQRAIRELVALRRELTAVRNAARTITLSVNTGALTRAATHAKELHATLQTLRTSTP